MKKKILLISYWVNKTGNSPGIMADDIIHSLLKLNYKIIVLSSFDCKKIKKENIIHFRVPSISFSDYLIESKRILTLKDLILFIFMLPLAITFGLFFNILEIILLKGKSGGKWFWFFLASPIAIFINVIYRVNIIFSTGGPACSHLTGILITFFSKKKLFSQLQDPLFGKGIGRSSTSSNYLRIFEKLLLKRCHKLIFVTKTAALESKRRNLLFKNKIQGIYTGALKQKMNKINLKKKLSKKKKIILTHLGTLYSSRNFKNLIQAIEFLSKQKKISLNKIRILNLGDIYGKKQQSDCNKNYITWKKSFDRIQALNKCNQSDILLLIQHTDDRSKLTFPYKVYEYLNLGKPILALINNSELKKMLVKRGHICANIKDNDDIGKKFLYLIKNRKKIKKNIFKLEPKYKIDHTHQCKKIFDLKNEKYYSI